MTLSALPSLTRTPDDEDAGDTNKALDAAKRLVAVSGQQSGAKRRSLTSSRTACTMMSKGSSTSDNDTMYEESMERQRQAREQMDNVMAEVTLHEKKQATRAVGKRNSNVLDFAAGHAWCSQQVRKILGSALVHQSASLSSSLLEMELRTQRLACDLFGSGHCELVLSGASALGVACHALLQSLDVTTYTIMTTEVAASSSYPLSTSFPGLCFNKSIGRNIQLLATPRGYSIQHPFDPFSLEKLGHVLEKHQPHLLILGSEGLDFCCCGSCSGTSDHGGDATHIQLWEYDLPAIRTLCDQYNCRIVYDITKVADLVAGRVFQTDLMRYVDVAVCTTGQALHAGGGRNRQGFL